MKELKSTRDLQSLGLSKNESEVYLTLLDVGSSKAGKLAKEASLDRSSTYHALNGLLGKGLASYVIIGRVKWFQPAHPARLKDLAKETLAAADRLVPSLSRSYSSKKLPENVRLFKGTKGVRTVLENIVQSAKENRMFGSEGQLEEEMPLFARHFVSELERRKVRVKSIVRMDRKMVGARFREVHKIPMDEASPVVTNVYGDKIAIIIWSKVPEAILIENAKAARAYRAFFDFAWKNSR